MDIDHALTVRMPYQAYRGGQKHGRPSRISINRLIQEANTEKAEKAGPFEGAIGETHG